MQGCAGVEEGDLPPLAEDVHRSVEPLRNDDPLKMPYAHGPPVHDAESPVPELDDALRADAALLVDAEEPAQVGAIDNRHVVVVRLRMACREPPIQFVRCRSQQERRGLLDADRAAARHHRLHGVEEGQHVVQDGFRL